MKIRFFAVLCAALVLGSCGTTKVTRVDAGTQVDLSGYWNDTDVRIVCDSLIKDCLDSPSIARASARKAGLPVIIVGPFRNDSDEHIETEIIALRMEAAVLNSGRADFVASGSLRNDLRQERQAQQSWASEETVKALANETGADFLLSGSVKTIVDRAGNTATRTYFVYAELTEIESTRKIWIGENSEIKKIIKNPGARL
jgi:PBP1b-binding outer membrane lipoprotein LpoB